jgi:hypothetical protein|tara:strand:- start:153 stop:818 length:666 start_codon:yes stop_codon:yes gene_type:complete
MGYFRELPDLQYQSFLSNSNSSQNYLIVKNLFRRCKLREDLQNVFTIFDKYEIEDGKRPDNVAEELYGNAELDWVVLICAGIVNIRDEWPLSNRDLYEYASNLYNTQLNEVHHYESLEIKDSQNKIIMPAGKAVNENFAVNYFDSYTNTYKTNPKSQSRIGISNYEYEVKKNELKKSIYILRSRYLQQFLNDMRQEMTYSTSSQYVSKKLARTENTRVTSP